MKFGIFLPFLFLIYETSFYLVKGQTSNEGKSDCTLLFNFLNGDSKDYSNDCCKVAGITCDKEGYIEHYSNSGKVIPDLASFPNLSRIKELIISNIGLKEIPDNIFKLSTLNLLSIYQSNIEIISPAIQNLSNLEIIRFYENKINELPNELFNLKQLKILNLRTNKIKVIPPTIQNLSKLEELYLEDNDIKELPLELFNFKYLTKLNLRTNNIEVVPPAIQNLSKLEYLYLKENDIKQLPKEIFNLKNLKKITLHDNKNLKTKIINFGNSAVPDCNLNNINILCYERHTCDKFTFNDKNVTDAEADKELKICTQKDIDDFYSENIDEKGSSLTIIGIIIGSIVVILITALVAFIIIKKRKSKGSNGSDISCKDEFRSGSIKVVLNGKQIDSNNVITGINNNNNSSINNDNNNVNSENNNSTSNNTNTNTNTNNTINNNNTINTNNNNNNNSNNSIIINNSVDNDIQKNLNQNSLYQNIIVNSNGYNSVIPGMVVLINNPQNPGTYIPLYNNNLDNSHTSIDMQNLLMYYNKNNMIMDTDKNNKEDLNFKSMDEKLGPPPEYSEDSKSIAKQQFM